MSATIKDAVSEAIEGPKEISKNAAEKARKKAEKAAKKAEYKKNELTSRPKAEPKPKGEVAPTHEVTATSVFEGGWLKRVYGEKPIAVRTRFPPEPNGYLHIGHAKAIAVNFGLAKFHNGVCFLRFDDTNPEKEEDVFFKSIEEIIQWLGFKPYQITYSSDHFDLLYDLAEKLILKDKAYVCHCSKEEVNMQRGGPDNRGTRFGCTHRTRPIEESLTEFRAMKDGKYKPGEAHLRMKQKIDDRTEGNPQMWDLGAYRVLEKSHHPRTGDKWKIYPTYDFTHCLCDAFEEISHSMCTTEFILSRVSYDWLLEELDYKLPKTEEKGPMQREYGRLMLEGTILSKRRITMLVDGATLEVKKADGSIETRTIPPAVRGWDDPRLHTLVAIRRRGVPAKAILQFIAELGVTDARTVIRTHKFDASIRKYLERTVPRLLLVIDPVKVTIEDLAEDYNESLTVPFDPKNPNGGSRLVPLSRTIYIDRSDFREEDSADFFRLAPRKTVGILNAPFLIRATSVVKDESGKVIEIKAEKAEGKPKAWIHWVDGAKSIKVIARQYNSLFNSDDPNELDWKTGGYADSLNSNSEIVYSEALIESAFADVKAEHTKNPDAASDDLVRFQAVRTGYFCVDSESDGGKTVLNQIVSLKEDAGKGK